MSSLQQAKVTAEGTWAGHRERLLQHVTVLFSLPPEAAPPTRAVPVETAPQVPERAEAPHTGPVLPSLGFPVDPQCPPPC